METELGESLESGARKETGKNKVSEWATFDSVDTRWKQASDFELPGCSKRPSSKAACESKPEAYLQGYVEDFDESRTKLAGFLSILLKSSLGDLIKLIEIYRVESALT